MFSADPPTVHFESLCAVFPAGNTNGWMLWNYRTEHPLEGVLRRGYFDDASVVLRDGDWIALNAARPKGLGYDAAILVVARVSGLGGVTVERI